MSALFDAVGPGSGGIQHNGITTVSWTHTPVGTPTAVAIFEAAFSGFVNCFPSGTYNGVSMAQASEVFFSGNGDYVAIMGLANPASGAQTVVMSLTAGSIGTCSSISVTGSDTSTCFRAFSSGANDGGTPSSTATDSACTSASGDLVVDICCFDGTFSGGFYGITPGAGQTQVWGNDPATNLAMSGSYIAGGSPSVTMSDSITGINYWIILSASFKSGAAPAFVIYNSAKKYISGTVALPTSTFDLHLYKSTSNFATNTLSTYGSLTNEIASANGYSKSGLHLTGVSWGTGASAAQQKWNFTPASLSASSDITSIAGYVIVARTGASAKDSANKLLGYAPLTTFTVQAGSAVFLAPPTPGQFTLA